MINKISSLILIGCVIPQAFAGTIDHKSQPKNVNKDQKVAKIESLKAVKRTRVDLELPLEFRNIPPSQKAKVKDAVSDLSRP